MVSTVGVKFMGYDQVSTGGKVTDFDVFALYCAELALQMGTVKEKRNIKKCGFHGKHMLLFV